MPFPHFFASGDFSSCSQLGLMLAICTTAPMPGPNPEFVEPANLPGRYFPLPSSCHRPSCSICPETGDFIDEVKCMEAYRGPSSFIFRN